MITRLHCTAIGLIGSILLLSAFVNQSTTPKPLTIPQGWPAPVYDFDKNPLTEEGFQLGRHLFYDPMLSRDLTISCASCHLQAAGFTHIDHPLSHGIEGRIGTRNTMTIMNAAWSKSFMWDGGINHLDVQALAPIEGPTEMDETLEAIVTKLNASPKYRQLFYQAFQDSVITGQRTLLAISQFVLQLNTSDSRYDKYIRQEAGGEFTDQEKRGLDLFRQHCASCHTEPLFTNQSFENNGLALDPTLNDIGRMKITQLASDSLKFKVPTLRNIQFTFPYMHDGRFKKLSEVLKHYQSGIAHSSTLAQQLRVPMNLTHENQIDLIAFLHTLSDQAFLFNPRYTYPR